MTTPDAPKSIQTPRGRTLAWEMEPEAYRQTVAGAIDVRLRTQYGSWRAWVGEDSTETKSGTNAQAECLAWIDARLDEIASALARATSASDEEAARGIIHDWKVQYAGPGEGAATMEARIAAALARVRSAERERLKDVALRVSHAPDCSFNVAPCICGVDELHSAFLAAAIRKGA